MGSHLSLAEPFRERDSFQVANAASAPNAGVHRLTGARHLPSRRRVTASWRSPGRTRGCIGSLAPSFCPAARVTASWRSPAFVHLRARRVRRWCSIAWCLFGWSLVLLDLRAYGSIASRCYMSPMGRGTPSPAVLSDFRSRAPFFVKFSVLPGMRSSGSMFRAATRHRAPRHTAIWRFQTARGPRHTADFWSLAPQPRHGFGIAMLLNACACGYVLSFAYSLYQCGAGRQTGSRPRERTTRYAPPTAD